MANKLAQLASNAVSGLKQESEVLKTLHEGVQATIERLQRQDPGLKQLLEDAYAYAVFPSIGKAGVVIGGAYGKGEVFEKGQLIGYAAIVQLTLGVQVGGETFNQIIAFENEQALARFKAGKIRFAANASAVLVKAGAAASARYDKGVQVFVDAEGGMLLELAVGGQKFIFKPAVLGRLEGKRARPAAKRSKRTPGNGTTKSRGSKGSRGSEASGARSKRRAKGRRPTRAHGGSRASRKALI
jgi:lipid-binding SYLF domain-containing protein